MVRWVVGVDAGIAWTRPVWGWVGQAALVLLGTHLAADRLDEILADWLARLPIAWPDPDSPLAVGTWAALVLEVVVAGWALGWLAAAHAEPVADLKAWWKRISIPAVVVPVLWAPLAAAGCWSVAMAVEDAVTPVLLTGARELGWVAAALVGWRFGIGGIERITRGIDLPERPFAAIPGALLAAPMAWLALRHGLPIWGWV
jgi:hypothetical protein